MKQAVVLIADTHFNSTKSICKPGFVTDDGNSHELSKTQRWLWETWERCLDEIEEVTSEYHKNIILLGDVVEIDGKYRSWQMLSRNPADILRLSEEILEPVVAMSDDFFVLRGTEAHTGKSAWAEEEIARDFSAVQDTDTGMNSWWHLRAEFGGVKFDLAHHASMGQLQWTYGNSAMKLSYETMSYYYDWYEAPPDIVARAHNHRFADSGLTYDTRAFFLPCWTYATSYLHRIGKANARPHIGALVFLCEDSKYDIVPLLYRPKREPIWKESLKR